VVCRRGQVMAGIQSERPGAMAAVIGLPDEVVAELCEQASESGGGGPGKPEQPDPGRSVGGRGRRDRLVTLAKETGAQRALRLQVGAAFHSELMAG
jgi:[acyl-carrier-protein] S-malonyltransferase